ncbi:UDP-N-acetylglucosamine 2-epimerase [Bdellovibrio bacteriovorus]|uniref:Putative UDP-N-acetylglucosamine-2-epimerase NeuC n=1 Tax=Bdellovibrio bacteriovorus (strain ATCC 15356 / DSM 50701 / NCIMB 9529 / HD100) TaxID=264462 RepID=Q6MMF3_BDEBA|nr:UDP-N-acetylglucosamine 2-epimerase [Bdellovibrio bacteriovorus]CAE79551.1 putative UDP-N-acetylglucosamine-2-epimerase NeuC [Bdellovibrio bacteriovorus HD100]
MKRRICVLSGTRADYGLLYWLMKELQTYSSVDLQIIATGMHLSPEFGMTYKFIEADGFLINEKVEMLLSGDSVTALCKSMGLGVMGISEALARLSPDLLVVLGDRFEALAGAQAAMIHRIPIAHLHGGEATEGLIDEAIRHSITKMSHLHFVAAEAYRNKVIQLGESPDRVFNFGATGIDNIKRLPLFNREEVEERIPVLKGAKGPVFLVTYHPVTLLNSSPEQAMADLLSAIEEFSDACVILTKSNADTAGRVINEMIDQFCLKHPERAMSSVSLGQKLYLSVMSIANVVVGNSSSGIIEAPAMNIPTVNIGPRQQGRAKAPSVLDCNETKSEIVSGIQTVLENSFMASRKDKHVYGDGNTAVKVAEVLASYDLDGIIFKKFYSIDGVK